MNRSIIIDAQGQRWESISAKRRMIRRMIAALVITLTAIFLSAAIIGMRNAAYTPQGPNADDIATLHNAEKANGKGNCWLEWNFEQNGFETICR